VGGTGQRAHDLPADHPCADGDARGHRFQGAAQAVGVLHHHQRTVHDDTGEGDRAGPWRRHDRPEVGGEVDAAVTGQPRTVRSVELADHGERVGERRAPRIGRACGRRRRGHRRCGNPEHCRRRGSRSARRHHRGRGRWRGHRHRGRPGRRHRPRLHRRCRRRRRRRHCGRTAPRRRLRRGCGRARDGEQSEQERDQDDRGARARTGWVPRRTGGRLHAVRRRRGGIEPGGCVGDVVLGDHADDRAPPAGRAATPVGPAWGRRAPPYPVDGSTPARGAVPHHSEGPGRTAGPPVPLRVHRPVEFSLRPARAGRLRAPSPRRDPPGRRRSSRSPSEGPRWQRSGPPSWGAGASTVVAPGEPSTWTAPTTRRAGRPRRPAITVRAPAGACRKDVPWPS
jgi:hypothetical protein